MEFIIITGLSGAGKSNAMRIMEDIGYYCVDNIPACTDTDILFALRKID